MGNNWSVTYHGEVDRERAKALIETELALVDSSMSTYRDDSEMARINRAGTAVWLELSAPFYEVLHTALRVGQASGGAYDVTVGPLVDLWGFGPEPGTGMPQAEQIAQALRAVGQQHIELDQANRRLLKNTALRLDFSSLAKGYAVDRIAQALQNSGLVDFLVEVGGEMRLSGLSPRGDKWRVAIERPASDTRAMAAAVRLGDISVATSGDYRNFFEHEGQRYSHSIDPRNGWPVAHELVSVTVLHPSAMLADAWATALTVLGPEQGRKVAQGQGLAVYFIQRDGDGFSHSHSAAFEPYLEAGGREDI
jgi:thiamine biosynthesis lipoprotein